MKALVLAGGAGTRLRPITHTSAKQLLPVANKPILFYGLESIHDAGIRDVGVVVGDTHEEIRAAVGDGGAWGLDVTYIRQDKPLGLAHAVLTAEDYLDGEDFVLFLGDNLLLEGIGAFVERFVSDRPNCEVLLTRVKEPERFGVAELGADGRVVRLVEKPKHPVSDLALVGVYLFDRHIFEAARAIKPSGRGELEITDAIQWLLDNDFEVHPHMVDGWWKDTGRLEDILEANRIVLDGMESQTLGTVDEASRLEGKVVVQAGASIEGSVIRGPAIVGEGTVVRGSYVGPFTSIYHHCLVEDSEIEHSVVLEESKIRGMRRIEDSLIGKQVEVGRSDAKPEAYRLMLGDHSRVGVIG
ncbi:MAG: glucose-1-phosphate thymidylyltransferase [Actinomycetota bacterium]